MLFKKITNSDSFRIYVWPIAVYWIMFITTLVAFRVGHGIEPDSKKETIFMILSYMFSIGLILTLTKRYEKIKGLPLNIRTIVILTMLTSVMTVVLIKMTISL